MKRRALHIAIFVFSVLAAGAVLPGGRFSSTVAAVPQSSSAVTPRAFAANWIIMTGQRDAESMPVLRLRLIKGHIVSYGAGNSGKMDLWRLQGRRLTGHISINTSKIPLSLELNSDGGQLIIIEAPPQSEYDVALAWREGYKPAL